MLIAKGYSPSFELKDGTRVRAPRGAALLHDPTGRVWPACSGLILGFTKERRKGEDQEAADYFGRDPLLGSLRSLPPKSLADWRRVGVIAVVNYRRIGQYAASYYHPIEKGTATLYRRGGAMRMELGRGCEWNWRGIVKP